MNPKQLLPHQQRLLEEHQQLKDRLHKLQTFLLSPAIEQLDHQERSLLEEQQTVMTKLLDILNQRIDKLTNAW